MTTLRKHKTLPMLSELKKRGVKVAKPKRGKKYRYIVNYYPLPINLSPLQYILKGTLKDMDANPFTRR